MKQLTTTVCCIALAIVGWFMFNTKPNGLLPLEHATINASPIVEYPQPKLPLDLQLDLMKHTPRDTVFVTDTVFKTPETIVKWKTRLKKDTVEVRDTTFVPCMYLIVPVDSLYEPIEEPLEKPLEEVPDTALRSKPVKSRL